MGEQFPFFSGRSQSVATIRYDCMHVCVAKMVTKCVCVGGLNCHRWLLVPVGVLLFVVCSSSQLDVAHEESA